MMLKHCPLRANDFSHKDWCKKSPLWRCLRNKVPTFVAAVAFGSQPLFGGCHDHSSNSPRLAKDRQLAVRPLRVCRGDRRVGGYPRDGFLSFFHGSTHIGHQSLAIVLCSLELCSLRLHCVSPFALEGNGPAPVSGPK